MPRRKPPIPRAFFLVAAANFLFFVNFSFFFLLPLWVLEHGGGEELAGRISGISGFAGLAVLPIIGYLLDRFGRRRFMIAGAVASAACSFAYLTVDGIGQWLYLLRVVQGIAFTLAFTGAQTLAVLFAPLQRRAEAIGWFGISTILPHAVSPPLGEEIIRRWGFDAMFAVGGCIALLAVLISSFIRRPPALVVGSRDGEADSALVVRAVATAAAAMLCCGFGFGATMTFVPVLMERLELGRVGPFFIAWSLAAVSVRILFGATSDRIGRRAVLVPAMFMMSAAVAALAFVRWYPGMIAIAVVFGFAQGLLYPTMNALVADWSNPRNIGRTQSVFSGSYSLGIASCAFFFGTIVEAHGWQAMFLTASAVTLLGLGIFLGGPKQGAEPG